jgi:superfamily II DNA or RNA helicase
LWNTSAMTVESTSPEESFGTELRERVWEIREDLEGNVVRQRRVVEATGEEAGNDDAVVPSRLSEPLDPMKPKKVLDSYWNAISFNAESADRPGLRTPQLGAVHAVLGYWTTNCSTPATVVMPTGTGKTETMLALLVAARPERLLVVVPSDALREQIAAKFEELGVLKKFGIVADSALLPVVGRVSHGFKTAEAADAFTQACNVVVATPHAIGACAPAARDALVSACSHLFIDEAHHVAAKTWSAIRDEFSDKLVVQFTATPFREDGRHLQGRIVYSFPLREAQRQGYFSRIDYSAVYDFVDVDRAIAEQSVARLRADREEGFDHVLMARVKSIDRAKQVLSHYEALAPDLGPVIINSRMPKRKQREALAALRARRSRIIVCVNMLGEGFDLPALKIAAVHDPQKSLGVTLQFVGRFTRTSTTGKFGTASAFVARKEIASDSRLRELYAEDADWDLILRDVTEAVVQEQQDASDFENGFSSVPEEVALRSLRPKLSTVVYRAPTNSWEPTGIVDHFGEDRLYSWPIGLNLEAGIAWCVVRNDTDVRWGDVRTLVDRAHDLYLLYFDAERRLLYINNSANDGVFQDLADAVLGPGATRFTGSSVYRVMADIDRLVPTNVGVLDAHDRFRRFSMHVSSDVTASFTDAEASTKSQTNISGGGYRDGEHVNISASLKGRIWTTSAAETVKHWRDWCDSVGDKLLDETIGIEAVTNRFILPKDLAERPEGVLLAAEWPWEMHTLQGESVRLSYQDNVHELMFTELVADTSSTSGAFRFAVKSGGWSVPYEARVENKQLRYYCRDDEEVYFRRPRSEHLLSHWLNDNGLLLIMDGDRIIVNDLLYKPTWEKEPFNRGDLVALDWTGTDLRIESQKGERRENSIQFRVIADLLKEDEPWDVVLDDDGSGEIADVVAIGVRHDELLIRFVHCKYSHGDTPGARVEDLYQVCGQAQKSIAWRRSDLVPFFRTLGDRARRKNEREGISPFAAGDYKKLLEIQDRSRVLRRRVEMTIVQPGLSAARATTSQLDVLASTKSYLKTTIQAPLTVWCSP